MTVEEYLRTGPVDLSYIAERMWPNNKNSKVYMSMKLNGKRPFTRKDAENALKVITELSQLQSNLTID